ncbi:unnamed protein product [Nesidiocoris tenuis]|uniref:Uncharacterized protein n=1 Tax=Nesidiocoris tenuis TaxID=355587 RepID=A0A6H5GD22_9HEMI|nr:unnamed protein product [Nesidiocoris tenuis]
MAAWGKDQGATDKIILIKSDALLSCYTLVTSFEGNLETVLRNDKARIERFVHNFGQALIIIIFKFII